MAWKFSLVDISVFIPKFTEATNQIEDLKAKKVHLFILLELLNPKIPAYAGSNPDYETNFLCS